MSLLVAASRGNNAQCSWSFGDVADQIIRSAMAIYCSTGRLFIDEARSPLGFLSIFLAATSRPARTHIWLASFHCCAR